MGFVAEKVALGRFGKWKVHDRASCCIGGAECSGFAARFVVR